MPLVQVSLGDKAFEFASFPQWVNKAASRFSQHGLTGDDVLAIDALGRICSNGAHFKRARDEDAFPVAVFRKQVPPASDDDRQPMCRATVDGAEAYLLGDRR